MHMQYIGSCLGTQLLYLFQASRSASGDGRKGEERKVVGASISSHGSHFELHQNGRLVGIGHVHGLREPRFIIKRVVKRRGVVICGQIGTQIGQLHRALSVQFEFLIEPYLELSVRGGRYRRQLYVAFGSSLGSLWCAHSCVSLHTHTSAKVTIVDLLINEFRVGC